MADSKTYLNVPFAQKDAAKALGARWDAANKKWYAPGDKDIALFAQWQTQSGGAVSAAPSKPKTQAAATKTASSTNNAGAGVITQAADKDFVAYNGDEAPWD